MREPRVRPLRPAGPGASVQRAAAASDSVVAEAAGQALARGNAVDAVVTGLLVAAARSPSVLLGPLQALVAGGGAGLLAVDGRVRQPGAGVPRPRGFVDGTAIPDAARVGVPGLPGALATLLASLGAGTLLRAAGPAVEAARSLSAERAMVLQSFARRGVPAVATGNVAEEIAAAAGRPAQGLLTRDDLAGMLPELVRREGGSLPGGWLTAPWRSEDPVAAAHCHVVTAIDGKGLAAVACYEAPPEGVEVPSLGLVLPFAAEPVRRGRVRIRPGGQRPAASPIALRFAAGVVDLCVGVGQSAHAEGTLDGILQALLRGDALASAVSSPVGRVAALSRVEDRVRILAGG